jgi:hypothetical protein
MPGPHGSTAAHVQALLPVPVLLPLLLLPLELAALLPPPCPVDVALEPPPEPLAVVFAPPVPLVAVVASAPPLPLVAVAGSAPPPQPQTAASVATGARNTIEDHRMKSSIPERCRARRRVMVRVGVKAAARAEPRARDAC